jgi:hypothetical protein
MVFVVGSGSLLRARPSSVLVVLLLALGAVACGGNSSEAAPWQSQVFLCTTMRLRLTLSNVDAGTEIEWRMEGDNRHNVFASSSAMYPTMRSRSAMTRDLSKRGRGTPSRFQPTTARSKERSILPTPVTWCISNPACTTRRFDRAHSLPHDPRRRPQRDHPRWGVRTVERSPCRGGGVAVDNMTARNFEVNGFDWTGVTGYSARTSRLTPITTTASARSTRLTGASSIPMGLAIEIQPSTFG